MSNWKHWRLEVDADQLAWLTFDRAGSSTNTFSSDALKELADVCVVVHHNTTPHVESFHVVLHHLITFCLAEKIRESAKPKVIAHAASSVS